MEWIFGNVRDIIIAWLSVRSVDTDDDLFQTEHIHNIKEKKW